MGYKSPQTTPRLPSVVKTAHIPPIADMISIAAPVTCFLLPTSWMLFGNGILWPALARLGVQPFLALLLCHALPVTAIMAGLAVIRGLVTPNADDIRPKTRIRGLPASLGLRVTPRALYAVPLTCGAMFAVWPPALVAGRLISVGLGLPDTFWPMASFIAGGPGSIEVGGIRVTPLTAPALSAALILLSVPPVIAEGLLFRAPAAARPNRAALVRVVAASALFITSVYLSPLLALAHAGIMVLAAARWRSAVVPTAAHVLFTGALIGTVVGVGLMP